MKHKSHNQPQRLVELDQETIADLELDDHDADVLRGGLTTKCPKGGDGGPTIILQ